MSAQQSTTSPANSQPQPLAQWFLAELVYTNYIANRENSPEISAERWREVYGHAEADRMEARYQDTLRTVFHRVPVCPQLNFEVRCQAYEAFGSSTGEQDEPCGKTPTLRCPGCGEWSDTCEAHLFEQEDGTRVCVECDGKPEFRKFPAASEMDADDYDAQMRKAVR